MAEEHPAGPLTAAPSAAAREDEERIGRFDKNARAFDARLESFERERDSPDEAASSSVQEGLHRVLEPLHPGLEVTARCTESVCVVELASEDSVGTMIARIAPWLRQSSDVATGDPLDPEDERAMRLAFEKSEVMALVDQPSELLP